MKTPLKLVSINRILNITANKLNFFDNNNIIQNIYKHSEIMNNNKSLRNLGIYIFKEKNIDNIVLKNIRNNKKSFYNTNINKINKNSQYDFEYILMTWVKDLLLWENLFYDLENVLGYYPTIMIIKDYSNNKTDIFERITMGKYSKEILIKKSLKLIISIAKRYNNSGLSFEDLIAEGILGLMKGIKKYDFSRGHKFSTYAHWWIRQAISRSIDDQSRIIRLPVYVKETLSKIKKIRLKFRNKFNRYPNLKELSRLSNIPEDRLQKLLISSSDIVSLDSFSDNDSDDSSYLNDYVEDGKLVSSEKYATEKLLKQDINEALLVLSDRESAVVRLRYGLDDGNERTLEEIGEYLNVTRERARQIEIKALKKLQNINFYILFKDYENLEN